MAMSTYPNGLISGEARQVKPACSEEAATAELVAEGVVVGELARSEGSDALTDVAAGTVEGRSAAKRRTLQKPLG